MPTPPGLSITELESVYDELAQAIEAAGPEKAQLLLVKLALLDAQTLGDIGAFRRNLEAAQRDL